MYEPLTLTWTYAAKEKKAAIKTLAIRHVHGWQILTNNCRLSRMGIVLHSAIYISAIDRSINYDGREEEITWR